MSSKPIIGMNADYRRATTDRPAYCLICAGYFEYIQAAGGIPLIVPPLNNNQDIEHVLDGIHGFLLTGGPDLDPRRDGFMLHPSVRTMDNRREDFDRRLVSLLHQRRMSVFGIGVGIQLLNVSQGGNLHLHIPEGVPSALPHKDPHDVAHRHGLEVASGSLMERVYGDGEIRVNSMHHMAVDDVAPGFRVTARCPDGIIEAIESEMDDWFAFGTQFHPEAQSASALDIRIFEEFIAGVQGATAEVRMVA